MNRSLAHACVAALLGVSACGSLPQTHYYRLALSARDAPNAARAGTLTIGTLSADGAYADDRIVYRASPYRLDYYNYHRWSAPPARALTDYLRDAYDRTGLFDRVTHQLDGSDSAVLSGRVIEFDEVDHPDGSWSGRVELELELLDTRSSAVLWQRRFREVEPIRARNPEGLAAALSAIMGRIVRESASELAGALRAHEPASSHARHRNAGRAAA